MSSIDLIRMGIKNLWRRKLRTFLTVLGVVIGTSSIIVMLSLGFGLSSFFEEQISQWGDLTVINVYKGWSDVPGKEQISLDDKAVESFKSLPNVVAVSPMLETYGVIKAGRYIAHSTIRGVDPSTMDAFGFKAAEGRLLESSDSLVAVFGSSIRYNFYDPKARVWREANIDLMKDKLSITLDPNYGWSVPGENKPNYKEYKIKTAGILEEGDWETSYAIYMPIAEVKKMIIDKEKAENVKPQNKTNTNEYNRINVKVSDINKVQEVQQKIKDMGHEAYSLNDQLEYTKKQAATIQAVLGGIGGVSLLVAAIGITNTMVMSIYERTKEIGIMKVIGASLKDIKKLFLFESALIGLFGGMLGIGFSYSLSYLVNKFSYQFGEALGAYGASKISIIPIWLVIVAMAFSALIGIISGYFPARRAMNLSALEAIRTE